MLTLYGAVQNDSAAQYALSAPIDAVVEDIAAPVGSAVGPGAVVARLKPTPATRSGMTSAASAAQAAQAAYARAQRLRADGLASDADVESARSAAAAAQAQQAAMATSARELTLRARSGGYVETIPVNPGDVVAAGAVIATLSRSGRLRASFGVDPATARQLTPGEPIRISTTSDGAVLTVPILSVNATIDPQTRLGSVFVGVPAGSDLVPGQSLIGQVPIPTGSAAITIPYAALLDDGGQPYVYVVKASVAHRRDVVTGPENGERIVIEKGLAAGEQVVTAGGTGVEDGMKVRTR
jgi:RND family efflux transporter MFP subunit